jgi:hypothetical protein
MVIVSRVAVCNYRAEAGALLAPEGVSAVEADMPLGKALIRSRNESY